MSGDSLNRFVFDDQNNTENNNANNNNNNYHIFFNNNNNNNNNNNHGNNNANNNDDGDNDGGNKSMPYEKELKNLNSQMQQLQLQQQQQQQQQQHQQQQQQQQQQPNNNYHYQYQEMGLSTMSSDIDSISDIPPGMGVMDGIGISSLPQVLYHPVIQLLSQQAAAATLAAAAAAAALEPELNSDILLENNMMLQPLLQDPTLMDLLASDDITRQYHNYPELYATEAVTSTATATATTASLPFSASSSWLSSSSSNLASLSSSSAAAAAAAAATPEASSSASASASSSLQYPPNCIDTEFAMLQSQSLVYPYQFPYAYPFMMFPTQIGANFNFDLLPLMSMMWEQERQMFLQLVEMTTQDIIEADNNNNHNNNSNNNTITAQQHQQQLLQQHNQWPTTVRNNQQQQSVNINSNSIGSSSNNQNNIESNHLVANRSNSNSSGFGSLGSPHSVNSDSGGQSPRGLKLPFLTSTPCDISPPTYLQWQLSQESNERELQHQQLQQQQQQQQLRRQQQLQQQQHEQEEEQKYLYQPTEWPEWQQRKQNPFYEQRQQQHHSLQYLNPFPFESFTTDTQSKQLEVNNTTTTNNTTTSNEKSLNIFDVNHKNLQQAPYLNTSLPSFRYKNNNNTLNGPTTFQLDIDKQRDTDQRDQSLSSQLTYGKIQNIKINGYNRRVYFNGEDYVFDNNEMPGPGEKRAYLLLSDNTLNAEKHIKPPQQLATATAAAATLTTGPTAASTATTATKVPFQLENKQYQQYIQHFEDGIIHVGSGDSNNMLHKSNSKFMLPNARRATLIDIDDNIHRNDGNFNGVGVGIGVGVGNCNGNGDGNNEADIHTEFNSLRSSQRKTLNLQHILDQTAGSVDYLSYESSKDWPPLPRPHYAPSQNSSGVRNNMINTAEKCPDVKKNSKNHHTTTKKHQQQKQQPGGGGGGTGTGGGGQKNGRRNWRCINSDQL